MLLAETALFPSLSSLLPSWILSSRPMLARPESLAELVSLPVTDTNLNPTVSCPANLLWAVSGSAQLCRSKFCRPKPIRTAISRGIANGRQVLDNSAGRMQLSESHITTLLVPGIAVALAPPTLGSKRQTEAVPTRVIVAHAAGSGVCRSRLMYGLLTACNWAVRVVQASWRRARQLLYAVCLPLLGRLPGPVHQLLAHSCVRSLQPVRGHQLEVCA